MKPEIQITPKQLRALVVLLLLLPAVPSAILVRFMGDAIAAERESAEDLFLQSQRRLLAGAVRRAEAGVPAGRLSNGDRSALLEDFMRGVVGPAAAVSVVPADREADEANVTKSSDGLVLRRRFPPPHDQFEVRAAFDRDDALLPESRAQIRRTVLISGGLIAAVAVTALAAGFAVTRQLRAEELRSDFLAAISHELKTPVASSRVLLDTLRDGGADDPELRRDYLELLAAENARIAAIIENFLAFWRLEQRREGFVMERVSVETVVREASAGLKERVDARGGTLRIDIRSLISDLKADRGAIVSALSCLLDNALKYTPEDGPEIRLDAFESAGSIFFQVTDNGVGVPPGERNRIFDKFYRADPRLSRRGGGCGLGLSIAKMIAEAHGGSIGVLRRVRKPGSIFWLQIPIPWGK